ncbi:hypothetical protein EZS27_032818 [termite gut metagenome]|uniref:Uncharacterized protein n=1 Tax=termite gut metagenome TaxID=433724 RepID=A0A5J4Q7V0_9ZZZZ
MQTPISYFTALTEPRVDRSNEHLMEDIIFITIALKLFDSSFGVITTFYRF